MFKAVLTACLTAVLTVALFLFFTQWNMPVKDKEFQAFKEMLGDKFVNGKDTAKHIKDCFQHCLQEQEKETKDNHTTTSNQNNTSNQPATPQLPTESNNTAPLQGQPNQPSAP